MPREVVSRGLLAVPIPLAAVRTSVLADTVELYSSTMAPPIASRVTVPGAEMLSRTTPAVLLISLLRSMSPFQVTLMFPADVEALRVNVLPEAVPLVTSMSPVFVVAFSVATFAILTGVPETPMPLPALRKTVPSSPLIVPDAVRQDLSRAGSAIGTDTGHDAAHVDCAAYNDVAGRAVFVVRVREGHDRGARFRQLVVVERELATGGQDRHAAVVSADPDQP